MPTHPAASLYPLVHLVWEGFAADVAPTTLRGVKAAVLQHNLTLADYHQGTSTHFCALKDVILHSLQEEEACIRKGGELNNCTELIECIVCPIR